MWFPPLFGKINYDAGESGESKATDLLEEVREASDSKTEFV